MIAGDRLVGSGSVAWSPTGGGSVLDTEGVRVYVRELDVIWWRRAPVVFKPPAAVLMERAQGFVQNNVRAALFGQFLADFDGVWIDHPDAIRKAENKLLQLRAASEAGFRVPRTIVSQDPVQIRAFWDSLDGEVVAKSVAGMLGTPALTGRIDAELVANEAALKLCPTIYQEFVAGQRHLRVHVFGDDVYAALIETEQLDWRYPLEADVAPYELDAAIGEQLRSVLSAFGLCMGIFDLKLDGDGDDPVWLELNPQGQFLFIEAMGGGSLINPFAAFLESRAAQQATAID